MKCAENKNVHYQTTCRASDLCPYKFLYTSMVKLKYTYHAQNTAQFWYEEPAYHLSLLKMTHWNVYAVV
jgi:hypothetical protein